MFRVGETVVCFAGEDAIISNIAPDMPIDIPGHGTFKSTEHAYQWAKLHWFGLHNDAERVRAAPTPRRAMMMTKGIHKHYRRAGSEQQRADFAEAETTWTEFWGSPVLRDLFFRKCAQHPVVKEFVRNNSHKVFVEATTNWHWGVGLHAARLGKLSDNEIIELLDVPETTVDSKGKVQYKWRWNHFGNIVGQVALMLQDMSETRPAPLDFGYFVAGRFGR